MRSIFRLFLLNFILISMVACSDEEPSIYTYLKGSSGINFETSQTQWQKLRIENGNSYTYTLAFQSWTGLQSETTLTINNGMVSQRSYKSYTLNHDEAVDTLYFETYTETGDSLGSHSRGVPLYSIDDLYATCANDYLTVDTSTNTLYFDTDEKGIISICGYTPDNCADDCFVGVRVASFRWLK